MILLTDILHGEKINSCKQNGFSLENVGFYLKLC